MCSYGDGCDLWIESSRRARKTYRACAECGEPIPVGELYRYLFTKYEGDVSVTRTHLSCAFLAGVLGDILCGGEYGVGQLGEHLRVAGLERDGSPREREDHDVALVGEALARIRAFYLEEIPGRPCQNEVDS